VQQRSAWDVTAAATLTADRCCEQPFTRRLPSAAELVERLNLGGVEGAEEGEVQAMIVAFEYHDIDGGRFVSGDEFRKIAADMIEEHEEADDYDEDEEEEEEGEQEEEEQDEEVLREKEERAARRREKQQATERRDARTDALATNDSGYVDLEEFVDCKPHDHCWHLGCILPKSPSNDRANRVVP